MWCSLARVDPSGCVYTNAQISNGTGQLLTALLCEFGVVVVQSSVRC